MKDKGFTLIELLTVLAILGLIALISVPIVTDIIHESRVSAAKDSTYGYIRAVESSIVALSQSHPGKNYNGNYQINEKQLINNETGEIITISYTGSSPEGSLELDKRTVIKATITVDGSTLIYDGKTVKETE